MYTEIYSIRKKKKRSFSLILPHIVLTIFIDREIESQGCSVTSPRSHSKQVAELGLSSVSLTSKQNGESGGPGEGRAQSGGGFRGNRAALFSACGRS